MEPNAVNQWSTSRGGACSEWRRHSGAERLELRACIARVAQVKAQTLQLLGLASDADVPQLAALERVDVARCTVAARWRAECGRRGGGR